MAGTCIVNHDWMSDKNNELLLQTSLDGTLYRLKRSKIVPDMIISVSGASLAFLFITNDLIESVLSASFTERVTRMRASFKHGYIIAVTGMASELQIMAALQKVYMNMPSAPFLPVIDADTGMEKLLRLAHVLAESRRLNSTRLIQMEREEFVQSAEVIVAALTKIPSINNKDAESVRVWNLDALLGLGSLSTIASASVDALMNGTTLTLAKANRVVNFFRDENCNRAPFLKR